MNVASLELCHELYELSGWEYEELDWWRYDNGLKKHVLDIQMLEGSICPAYDLGYLLQKIGGGVRCGIGIKSYASYKRVKTTYGDTPEDAAAKLAIELFKQGVLTKENQ